MMRTSRRVSMFEYSARICQALRKPAHSCSGDVETALLGPEELHLERKVDEEVRVMCTRGNPV